MGKWNDLYEQFFGGGKVAMPSSFSACWLWVGSTSKVTGYGKCTVDSKTVLAHRRAYELAIGPIPEGLTIDHLCRVRNCVNPLHLEAVSQAENLRRAPETAQKRNAAKTHCSQGHPYTPENTRIRSTHGYSGHRDCKECNRIRVRANRQKESI